jgi:hypothetical protein
MSQKHELHSLRDIVGFPNVCITGGEPLLYPEKLLTVVATLRQRGHDNIFLYTAMYTPKLVPIVHLLDGVFFTLHAKASQKDIGMLLDMQILAKTTPECSFRACIHTNNDKIVPIVPSAWDRLTFESWDSIDGALPPNEVLFEYIL